MVPRSPQQPVFAVEDRALRLVKKRPGELEFRVNAKIKRRRRKGESLIGSLLLSQQGWEAYPNETVIGVIADTHKVSTRTMVLYVKTEGVQKYA